MRLEYLDNISVSGKYEDVVSENLIRLYDFSPSETSELTRIIHQALFIDKQKLDLSTIDFIEPVNCQLALQLSRISKGIIRTEKPNEFICELTEQSFINAIERMKAIGEGFNWLCDTSDDDIDFLYSPGGTW